MSKRLLRINELLGQEISKIFSKEIEIPEVISLPTLFRVGKLQLNTFIH